MLEGERLATWTRFLKAHSAISRRLERDLADEHSLTLSDYDVLLQLYRAPDRPCARSSSQGGAADPLGITRLIQGLEREGLVERTDCPDDARGFLVALTPAGARSSRRPARPTSRASPSCSATATRTRRRRSSWSCWTACRSSGQ